MAAAELPVAPGSVLLRVLEPLPVRNRLRAASSLSSSCGAWCGGIFTTACGRCSCRTSSALASCPGSSPPRCWPPSGRDVPTSANCPQQRWSSAVSCESITPSLTTLELSRCGIPHNWFCGSTLKNPLWILDSAAAAAQRHRVFSSPSERLLPEPLEKTLSLFGTHGGTDKGFWRVAPRPKRLTLRCCDITDSGADSIGRHTKRLRFLKLSDVCVPASAGLASLAALRRWEVLCLKLRANISLRAVTALCQVLPQLRNLKLGGVYFKDEVINKIVSLPHCGFSHTR
ncbi:LOW QUALITY PROTEIN: uncharacterized protein FN964_015469 [Alca torda]